MRGEQQYLMPASLAWLPEGHLASFVLDTLGELELGVFCACYRDDGPGGHAYELSVMAALPRGHRGPRADRESAARSRHDLPLSRVWNSTSAILVTQIHSSSDTWRAVVSPPPDIPQALPPSSQVACGAAGRLVRAGHRDGLELRLRDDPHVSRSCASLPNSQPVPAVQDQATAVEALRPSPRGA